MTEEQLIEQYEKKLNELYARANTKSKKKKIVYDLFRFSKMSCDLFGIDKEYEWENDIELLLLVEDYHMPFIDNTLENRILYSKMATSVIDNFKNANYPFYKDYGKLYYSLTDKEFEDIIFSFLNDYDLNLLKRFREKLENYEIFNGSIEDWGGLTYPIESLNKNLIFFESGNGNSIYTASVLLHEFGHTFEYDIFNNTGALATNAKANITPYYEVSSRFFEYAFIKYLNENKINIKDSSMCLRKYLIELLWNMYNVSVLSKMKNINIDEYGFAKIEEEETSNYANKLKEELNFCYPFSDIGEAIGYRDSYIYGIGSLFSIDLYENYKQDPNNFKKEFKNALLLYPNGGIEAFERVGVTPEILTEGKTLRKVLADSR